MEKADAVDISYPEKIHLLTTLAVNPEPIILQVSLSYRCIILAISTMKTHLLVSLGQCIGNIF